MLTYILFNKELQIAARGWSCSLLLGWKLTSRLILHVSVAKVLSLASINELSK
jgi:hypothetical protein